MKKVSSATLALFGACLVVGAEVTPAQAAPRSAAALEQPQRKGVTVKGVVKDKTGEPIVGANVIEKGTQNGTITDFDGKFQLTVESNASVLHVSFVGYESQELQAKSQLNIVLEEDHEMLDDVVVIGYGTQKKGDVTSAVASVKAEDFTKGKIGDAAELIKGKVAGLSVTNSSGDPNATSSIMLRGATTIMGDVTPLILVDGIEGDLSTVAPENIAAIDVLKDASAAAIYGTRGANGVIIITTKTGRRDSAAKLSYSGYVSFTDWTDTADFMDTNDIIYGRTNFNYEGYDTDWLKAVTRKAGSKHNHSVSLEGGSKNFVYSANITYSNEQGIMRKSDAENFKVQADITQYMLNDMLKINISMLKSSHKSTNNNNAYVYREAIIRNPSSPIYNSDGSYNENFGLLYYYNPVGIQNEMEGDSRSTETRLVGNITLEPIKGWKTNLMLARDESNSQGQNYNTAKYYSNVISGVNGWASKSSNNGRSDNLEATTQYDLTVGKHRANFLAGYSYLYNVYDGFSEGNGNFPTEYYKYNKIESGTYLTDKDHHASMSSYKNDNKLIGFFGRVSYAYGDRYNALVSIRREGSSKFGENHKWGTFSSVSLGWNLHNEKFLKEVSWLNNLKLRAGYGVTGVIPNDSYLSLYMYDYDSYGKHYSTSGTWEPSLQIVQNYNPDLKWEKTKEWNIGLDWAVLNERLSGSIDLYTKRTDDLLYDYAVPMPPNLYGYTRANVGSIRNNGIEVLINAVPVKTRNFQWNTTVTLSHNTNKLLSLSNDLYETDNFMEVGGVGEPISVATHCMEVGHSLGDFWGLKSVGVSENGVVLVEVSDGNGGWKIDEFDTAYNEEKNRQRLGNGTPSIYFGWGNTLRYRGIDLSMQFTGQFGFEILNAQRSYYENNSIAYNRLKSAADLHPAVTKDLQPVYNEDGSRKMVAYSSSMQQGIWSDQIEDGDFLKLSSLTLGYTLPLKGTVANYLHDLRLYVSGTNLLCFTGYSGIDPEVDNYFMAPGIDYQDKYPTTRSFTIGLNFNF